MVVFACLWIAALLAPSRANVASVPITPGAKVRDEVVVAGVRLVQQIVPPPKGPLVVNMLIVDPKTPGIRMETALGQDVLLADDATHGRESVGSIAARHGAIAAINGDYFPYTGNPVGLVIRNGEFVRDSLPNRAAWGLTSTGVCLFGMVQCRGSIRAPDGAELSVSGINRPPGNQEMVLLTPVYGARCRVPSSAVMAPISALSGTLIPGRELRGIAGPCTPGDPSAPIPTGGAMLAASGTAASWMTSHLHPGDAVTLRFDLETVPEKNLENSILPKRPHSSDGQAPQSPWNGVVQAVGGGPWLVRDGRVLVDGVEEGFNQKTFVDARHPRTAIALLNSGEIALVTVDGRQPQSRGVTLNELAEILMREGAVEAVNLDGGGSTSMWVAGAYVNAPSDGAPNAIADAILVYADATADAQKKTATTQEAAQPPAASQPAVKMHAGEAVQLSLPDAADRGVLWGVVEGTAFVDQTGTLTACRAGSGTAVAWRNGTVARFPFEVLPGPPAALRVSLGPAPNNPPDRSILHIAVVDRYGNGVPTVPVSITVRSGTADPPHALTDPHGVAEAEIIWDAPGGAVQVHAGKLAAHLRH